MEDLIWYEEHYPGANLSWVVSALFQRFRSLHTLTPNDYATLAAQSLINEIEGN